MTDQIKRQTDDKTGKKCQGRITAGVVHYYYMVNSVEKGHSIQKGH
jgi:hypothetical protein